VSVKNREGKGKRERMGGEGQKGGKMRGEEGRPPLLDLLLTKS